MSKCNDCGQEMQVADGCLIDEYRIKRVRYGEGKETNYITEQSHPRCHDCGVKWGECHHPGCDMEDCPICGEQLITCEHGELLL